MSSTQSAHDPQNQSLYDQFFTQQGNEWHVDDALNPKLVYVPKDSVSQFMKAVSQCPTSPVCRSRLRPTSECNVTRNML